eukprot:Nitzschia sp. Nitz4//scaffold110_size71422//37193//38251//NITZ4_005872-RA/size71422-processed-gene-0.58-mRNA-1//1//CDS//3329533083//839//frame0
MKSLVSSLLFLFFVLSRNCTSITVLTTERSTETQWTCFDTDSASACCQGILEASLTQESAYSPPEPSVCVSQISAVPTIDSLQRIAKFSLIQYHGQNQPDARPRQFLWTDDASGDTEKPEVDSSSNHTTTIIQDVLYFPFVLEPVHPSPMVEVHSELSSYGGMHRLLHSRISTKNSPADARITSTYLFLTLSNSMFMDLDDALVQDSVEASVTTVHSAGVCDIEQPAFASGQHVAVLESTNHQQHDPSSTSTTTTLELSSKVHFRYPVPSPDRHQWSILFLPQVLVRSNEQVSGTTTMYTTSAALPQETQKVWVAAGSDADYVWVMGTTLVMALLGTISMLQNFSLVAQWDA